MNTFTMDDYRIGLAGGYSYDPARETAEQGRVKSALATARAYRAYLNDPAALVEWKPSALPWDGDFPMAVGTILLDAVLWLHDDDGDHVAGSLCCVNVYSERDAYCRVVEADLYAEIGLHGTAEEVEREAMAARDIETVAA